MLKKWRKPVIALAILTVCGLYAAQYDFSDDKVPNDQIVESGFAQGCHELASDNCLEETELTHGKAPVIPISVPSYQSSKIGASSFQAPKLQFNTAKKISSD